MTDRFDVSRREFLKAVSLGAAGAAMGLGIPTAALGAETQGGIPYRDFGKTGLKIPAIVYGSMDTTQANANVLRAAVNSGLIMIDTAPAYSNGNSEIAVGEVVKAFGRDKILLHTKASGLKHEVLRTQSDEEVEKALRGKLEESLKRLQTDHVDTYLAPHAANNPDDINYPQLRAAVEKLKKDGLIRFFGISSHQNYTACCLAAIESGWHDFIMPSVAITTLDPEMIALANQSAEEPSGEGAAKAKRPARQRAGGKKKFEDLREAMAKAQQNGLGVLCMKIAKYVPEEKFGQNIRAKYVPDGATMSHHQICYKFILDQPFCSAVSVGMGTIQHLEEALQLPSLTLKTA